MLPEQLLRRGLFLEYTTLGWNVVGCLILLYAAIAARSVALAGFGIDSAIEIFASIIVVWQLKAINKNKEKFALRLIASAFILLAAYIVFQSLIVLSKRFHAGTSYVGLLWLIATFIAMLLLAWGKRVTGNKLGNATLIAESTVTVVDAYLAGATLVGVAANTFFGFWWADPLAGFVIVFYAIKEVLHIFKS